MFSVLLHTSYIPSKALCLVVAYNSKTTITFTNPCCGDNVKLKIRTSLTR